MSTSDGEASPTWMVNMAPPMDENSAATAKMKALYSAGS